MNFNAQTKISDIIRYNDAGIDAIAAIAPPLRRLKNPVLRKLMASRVTVAEAAKMGGCTVADFVQALEPLGYHFVANDRQHPVEVKGSSGDSVKPGWLANAPDASIVVLDVRPVIEQGTDPLKEIMQKFKELPAGQILCVINLFVPTPLIHLLEKDRAEASFVDTVNEKEFHTYFLKKQPGGTERVSAGSEKVVMHDAGSFEKISGLFEGSNRRTIDVRNLEMPLPMQTILGELESLPSGMALYVHHKRVPVFLLEELASKDFAIHIFTVEEGNVKMLIFKDQAR